jgi:hypothetical protein
LALSLATASAFALACAISVDLSPTPTAISTTTPSPTPRYTPLEQGDLQAWCTGFRELYYGGDLVRADVNEWLASQGAELTQADIEASQGFSDRFTDLYERTADLTRPVQVREINDLLAEAFHSELNAYKELYTSYTTGDPAGYDNYVAMKREAERLTTAIIDLFNDLMLQYDIVPVDCSILPS